MPELKGLILSGGSGTRLRPITHTRSKQLVPVANKSVLFYGLESLAEAGITDIGMIISPETGDEIREAVGDGSHFGVAITYVEQPRPEGLAHAVLTAADFLGESPFVMYLGDNLLRNGIRAQVDRFRDQRPDAAILLTEVEDPSSYGVAELDEGRVTALIEKPAVPPSNLALVGVYFFTSRIIEAARHLAPSARGEYEITEAIQALIEEGADVRSEIVSGWWKDTGQLNDILEANRLVLDEIEDRREGEAPGSTLEGRVVIEAGATVRDSLVRGPVVIGAGAVIEGSYVGPYTAIGEDVTVSNSEIEHSILLAGSSVRDIETRIESSLLGREVKVERGEGLPRTMQLLVGDRSELRIV